MARARARSSSSGFSTSLQLLDLDGDGSSNRDEFSVGTDPGNPTSQLRLQATQGAAGLTLSFEAQPNRVYTIQFTDQLETNTWQPLSEIAARPNTRTEAISDPTPTHSRFYRVSTPAVR